MAVRLSALHAGRPLPPGRFLVLISLRGWVDPRAILLLVGLGQLKRIHLIGTRTRDFLICSIVPQPTTLPRAPRCSLVLKLNECHMQLATIFSSQLVNVLQIIMGVEREVKLPFRTEFWVRHKFINWERLDPNDSTRIQELYERSIV
jgi:hypothetical protein